jgi:hypothetical protein
MLGYDFDDNN